MRVIYKYPLMTTETQMLSLPVGAEILSVQTQGPDDIVLYAVVDPSNIITGRIVNVIPTDYEKNHIDADNYVGTVKRYNDMLVHHVFIEPEGDLTDG